MAIGVKDNTRTAILPNLVMADRQKTLVRPSHLYQVTPFRVAFNRLDRLRKYPWMEKRNSDSFFLRLEKNFTILHLCLIQ